MKEEYILEVPENVRYISEWKNLQLPKGHYIMDKVVTGCGFTEYFLNNSIPVILCSPRKVLLSNKHEQHPTTTYLFKNEVDKDLMVDFNLNEKYNDCVKLINIIISKNTETVHKSSYNVLADWFRLVGKLTDMVTSEIEAQYTSMSPYSYRYIELAREYISENYARRLSADEVAAHTGISSGYLQLIFRQHVNMGVTEYINYHKAQLAKQYIRGRRLSLKDISVQLGIDDPSYMSRLFKKIEGISYREYCQKYLGN